MPSGPPGSRTAMNTWTAEQAAKTSKDTQERQADRARDNAASSGGVQDGPLLDSGPAYLPLPGSNLGGGQPSRLQVAQLATRDRDDRPRSSVRRPLAIHLGWRIQ